MSGLTGLVSIYVDELNELKQSLLPLSSFLLILFYFARIETWFCLSVRRSKLVYRLVSATGCFTLLKPLISHTLCWITKKRKKKEKKFGVIRERTKQVREMIHVKASNSKRIKRLANCENKRKNLPLTKRELRRSKSVKISANLLPWLDPL